MIKREKKKKSEEFVTIGKSSNNIIEFEYLKIRYLTDSNK